MAGWNLSDILNKVRATTGRVDESMLSSTVITDYINKYYQYVLPKELKIFWGYTYYTFFCNPNIDQYPAPSTFQTLNPRVWADGFPIEWYLSPDEFFTSYPEQTNKAVVAFGDGITNSFTYNIPAFPIVPRSLYVTDGTQIAQDTGNGTFYDPNTGLALAGSVDYATGAVVGQSFSSIPIANVNITEASETYMPNRPQAILFYKSQPLPNAQPTTRDNVNMFVLRPIPDQVYKIKMEGIQVPAGFDLSNFVVDPNTLITTYTDVPFRADLGPLIAYGASLEIFADLNQMDQYDQILPQYNRYKDISMQDTYEEYMYERSLPRF